MHLTICIEGSYKIVQGAPVSLHAAPARLEAMGHSGRLAISRADVKIAGEKLSIPESVGGLLDPVFLAGPLLCDKHDVWQFLVRLVQAPSRDLQPGKAHDGVLPASDRKAARPVLVKRNLAKTADTRVLVGAGAKPLQLGPEPLHSHRLRLCLPCRQT